MKNENRFLNVVLAGTIFMLVIGCSSRPTVEEFADTASPTDELQRFATDMHSALERQVNVLAPSSYEKASEALLEAQKIQKKGKDAKEALHEIAVGRSYLARANQMAEVSRTNLEAVAHARQAAIVAGAPKTFAESFRSADDNLKSLTSDIERNDLSDVADNRDQLQKEYLDVELKAIKQSNLGAADMTIALAIKEGAKEYAKQSLAIAQKSVDDADAFIVANRHQSEAVKAKSLEATTAANHLLKITRASKAGKNVNSEQAALQLETERNKTQNQRDQLSFERKTAKDLAVETGGLKTDAAFNQSFEAARHEFNESEAQVYRQGDNLVIRLRTLEFPTNQSVIKGSNFALLGKVAKVVKGFENSSVVIEGHTDSDGGKVLNDRLSAERARAVSDYLVSSEAIIREKITSTGYGFDRPLASNKTAKGKAQNRRVDVVISPDTRSE